MVTRNTKRARAVEPAAKTAPPPRPRRSVLWILSLAGVLAGGGIALWSRWPPPAPERAPVRGATTEAESEGARALARLRELKNARLRQVAAQAAAIPDAAAIDDDERARRENEGDPVASLVPLLAGQTPEQQLEYLKWARHLPEDGFVAVFPDLATRELDRAERGRPARSAIEGLIGLLEAEGVRVPDLPQGFQPVQVVEHPPPVEMPPSLREDYKPFPGDPNRHDPAHTRSGGDFPVPPHKAEPREPPPTAR